MNVVVFILLLSFSRTGKGMKRIPIRRTYGADFNENEYSEGPAADPDDDNPQIERHLDVFNDTKNDEIITKTTEKVNGELKFTAFILEAAKVLKTYENRVLELAFGIIDEEVSKDVYKGCKAHELADIRKYATGQLTLLKDAPADKIRDHLSYVINVLSIEDFGDIRDLAGYINSLYVGESEKFIEILLNLVHRRISDDVDLAAILKNALNTLIFDHFCNLDNLVRRELIKMIKHCWRQFISKVVNNKNSLSKDNLPFVTPFVNENSIIKEAPKKRRFNRVKAGKPLVKRWKDKSESGEYVNTRENKHIRRANSVELNDDDFKLAESESAEENILNNFRAQTDTTEGITEIQDFKPVRSIQPSARMLTTPKLKNRFSMEHIFENNLRQPNNTIEKLINIGTLAQEINDIVSEDKALRQGGYMMNWDWVGTELLGLMAGKQGITTKPNEGNERKNVVISMKAKYQE